jgi:hypothetical protein
MRLPVTNKKTFVKGGTLIYAIAISLIISILASFLIMGDYYQRIVFESDSLQKKAISDLQCGINLLLADPEVVPLNEKTPYDLFDDGLDSVILQRRNWGAFYLVNVSTKSKNQKFERCALTGNSLLSDSSTALYLANNGNPLAVAGKTLIRGNCYLPKKDIKQAYIEGENFEGEKPVYGKIEISASSLPEINSVILEQFEKLLNSKTGTDSLLPFSEFSDKDSISNSFINNTLVIDCSSEKSIENKVLRGNIILYSEKDLSIAANNIVEDVIIVAKRITFEKEFKGTLQAFSKDTINVKENCTFIYPSVLGVIKTAKSESAPAIFIGENTIFNGYLLALSQLVQIDKPVSINISTKVEITGMMYSNGIIDIKGILYGGMWTQKLLLKTASGVYENHLLNVTIDRTKLSRNFAGVNLFKEESANRIAKWLN